MPLIHIYRKASIVSDAEITRITAKLAEIVAQALDIPELQEGKLTAGDIEIIVHDQTYLSVSNAPLCIIIHANDYPERRANLKERTRQIVSRLEITRKSTTHGFVWVQLIPSSFIEF